MRSNLQSVFGAQDRRARRYFGPVCYADSREEMNLAPDSRKEKGPVARLPSLTTYRRQRLPIRDRTQTSTFARHNKSEALKKAAVELCVSDLYTPRRTNRRSSCRSW